MGGAAQTTPIPKYSTRLPKLEHTWCGTPPELLGGILERLAVLLHGGEHDVAVAPELLGGILERPAVDRCLCIMYTTAFFLGGMVLFLGSEPAGRSIPFFLVFCVNIIFFHYSSVEILDRVL